MENFTTNIYQGCRWSVYGFLLCLILGCNTIRLQDYENSWKTYKNTRYGFEFPYPSGWYEMKSDNNDGIMFISPKKSSVQIRSWAGNQMVPYITGDIETKTPTNNSNFKNVQGIPGMITVEIGARESLITLKLAQNRIKYYWQGKAPSQEFDDYYQFFYYIAENYRLPELKIKDIGK